MPKENEGTELSMRDAFLRKQWEERVKGASQLYPINQLLIAALERYHFHRIRPGSFLMACLENDLFGACLAATRENSQQLYSIVRWIDFVMPRGIWGSPLRVRQWLEAKNES